MDKSSKIYKEDRSFSVTFQLRPRDRKILLAVEDMVEKRKNVFITKFEEKKFGYDLYLKDQQFVKAMATRLKKRFNGDVKITRSLYGINRQTSRKVYRLTVLFRLKEEEEESQ